MPLEKALRAALVDGTHYLPGDPIDTDTLSPKILADLLLHEVLPKPTRGYYYQPAPVYAFGKPPAIKASALEHEIAQAEADAGYRAPDGTPMVAMPVGQASQTPNPATPPLDGPGGPALVKTAPDNPGAGGAERKIVADTAAVELNTETGDTKIIGAATDAIELVADAAAATEAVDGTTRRRR